MLLTVTGAMLAPQPRRGISWSPGTHARTERTADSESRKEVDRFTSASDWTTCIPVSDRFHDVATEKQCFHESRRFAESNSIRGEARKHPPCSQLSSIAAMASLDDPELLAVPCSPHNTCDENVTTNDQCMQVAKVSLLLRLRRLRTSLKMDIERVEKELQGMRTCESGSPSLRTRDPDDKAREGQDARSGFSWRLDPWSLEAKTQPPNYRASASTELTDLSSLGSTLCPYDTSTGSMGRCSEDDAEWCAARADAALRIQNLKDEASSEPLASSSIQRLRDLKENLRVEVANGKAHGLTEVELREAELLRRRIHNVIEDRKGQLRVFCRVRPMSEKERSSCEEKAIDIVDNMTIRVPDGTFSFDGVFEPGTQGEVFDECRDLVQSAMDGHNVTIFTFGQTGAGKTFTMYGSHEDKGIAPRIVDEVFRLVEGNCHRCAVSVCGSLVEIYGNQFLDLLAPRRDVKLSQRHDKAGVLQLDNLTERQAKDAGQLQAMLDRGLARRAVATTAMSVESSRSHLIFTIRLTTVNHETQETLRGKILLIDLGGSERLKKSEVTGPRKKEAIEINKSLSALGDVIEAVTRKQRQVPYRNNKLTQFMRDSLGGTAKTLMFVNCSPVMSNISESILSLKFSSRAKRVSTCSSSPMFSRRKRFSVPDSLSEPLS